jgi:hypothetical protein
MVPSTSSTTINSVTPSSKFEAHTNLTVTFDITTTNLMEAGSYIDIDFDRVAYPLYNMMGNIKCTMT